MLRSANFLVIGSSFRTRSLRSLCRVLVGLRPEGSGGVSAGQPKLQSKARPEIATAKGRAADRPGASAKKVPARNTPREPRSDGVSATLARAVDLMKHASKRPKKSSSTAKLLYRSVNRKFLGHDRKHSARPNGSKQGASIKHDAALIREGVVRNNGKFSQAKKPAAEEIPRIAHGLDRVLFSPGVHFLQDPRTRIFNFTKYLEKIRPYDDFDSSKFPGFVTSSKDQALLLEAIKQNKTYYSSTSSMTLTLIQFYLLLNNYTVNLASEHRFNYPKFTRNALRMPLCLIVEPKGTNNEGNTVYSVTSDKSTDVEILLLALGHCLEALLTTEENEFAHYLIKSPNKTNALSGVAEGLVPEKAVNLYNYSSYGGFLMRSQLDCFDPRLPGNGTFDLKTRAACAIRYDQHPDSARTNYRISRSHGRIESFEREYSDLIKTGGLLKYGFQARIGQMDGIFIAYHSVNSFRGFQYLPLSEIDRVFYTDGRVQTTIETRHTAEQVLENDNIASVVAENQFKVSLAVWKEIMDVVVEDFKGTEHEGMPYRLIIKRETRLLRASRPRNMHANDALHESYMTVFALPMTHSKIEKLQNFASQFKTSFRENLTQEQRLLNLLEAERKLNELNSEVVEDVPLLSYRIKTHYQAKNCSSLHHPYPASVREEAEWRYTIEREEGKYSTAEEVRKRYLALMKIGAEVISMSSKMASSKKRSSSGFDITLIVRKYGEVGRLRDEQWRAAQEAARSK